MNFIQHATEKEAEEKNSLTEINSTFERREIQLTKGLK